MKSIKIPGFYAQNSVGASDRPYQRFQNQRTQQESTIVPQLRINPGGTLTGGGTVSAGPSCTFRCDDQKNARIQSCDDLGLGYTCYLSAWASYYACLASCVTGGGGLTGGSTTIA